MGKVTMGKLAKRLLTGLLTFSMVAGTILPAVPAEAASKLVNVAASATATTENGSYGEMVVENIVDGDEATMWQTEGVWPTQARVQLDMGRNISKVVVKLGVPGDYDTGRTALVTVQYAQNGVISDLVDFGTHRMNVDSDYEFVVDGSVSATDFFITLSDPQNADGSAGGFWPAVEEVEIYELQEETVSDYQNIAAQAEISVTGNNEGSGSENLTDGNDATLYKFFNAAMTSEQIITLSYAQARTMDAFRIAFENVGTTDSIDFEFTYSILGKNKTETEYTTIVDHATANRTDNSSQLYQFDAKLFDEVQIVMHSCTTYGGSSNGWPAVAEFDVYGSEEKAEDDGSISNGKTVHVSSGKNLAKNINDGSLTSAWRGAYYPSYVDIDLEENYNLDKVEVFTPESGYSQYTIYTSMDGRDFTKLAEKTSTDSCDPEVGEAYDAEGTEARIVRVYLEYNSNSTAAVLNEVRVFGTPSGTEIQERPEVNVPDFEDSEYADTVEITEEDTYEEVYGIIGRQVGEEYKDWFTLELAENPKGNGYDYYEISTEDGKVHVKGNDGVSLASGINHFLKYYCQVNISQVGNQVNMPDEIPVLDEAVFKETKAAVRYSYNYCTLSYSMAFYGEEEWRNELDWLALNGVNVVLDATAQEEVWRRFLGKLGYDHASVKDYIAGPAYYAWAYMANLSGFGGPVHDSWFEERTELARENQLSMRKLGMQPVLQGYSGMVPTDIQDYDPDAQIIAQGNWCSFQRPAMLVTTSDTFNEYAALFYECQEEVYGPTSDYYATDPFHEGGNTGGMNSADISEKVLTEMLKADEDAIWIIQAWQGNPTTALLNGLDRVENGAQHALVLDLYAEKTPHNQETGWSYGDEKEFDKTPWVYCMLNNFGGRLGMHGHLDNMAKAIPEALNNAEYMAGIGITPEASVNNPVLYEFIFETIWQDDADATVTPIDLDTWLDDYATRRYGAESEAANQAWDILKETVYKSSYNNLGQGAPESVVNARPALSIGAASTWGNAVISYDKVELEKAAELLLEDYDVLKDSEGYLYDVATVLQQVLSNSAQEYHKKMSSAFSSGNQEKFDEYSAAFLEIIDNMETVTATSEYYLLGRWVEMAKALGKNADDFTKELYEFNAKALVTTWGSINQAENGGLKDYSNRQWSGLINDFYKERWERWITARHNELAGEQYETSINWFQWEWEWVRDNKEYTTTPTPADLDEIGLEIIEKFSSFDPDSSDADDIPVDGITVYAENYQPNNTTEGDPNYVLDGNSGTHWHTVWSDSARDTHYLIFTFDEVTEIAGMRFLQRNATNGLVTKIDLLVRESEDAEWTLLVDDAALEEAVSSWTKISFDPVNVKQVKLQVVDAKTGDGNKYAAAAEVRFTKRECAHEWSDWTVTTAATCTEKGEQSRTCSVCEVTETEEIAKVDHQMGEWTVVKEATTEEKGLEERTCANCDYKEEKEIPKKEQETVNPFEDVSEKDYFYNAVLWAVENKVTTGDTETLFAPYKECNRGQIVLFLYRALNGTAVDTENPFTDVSEADYCYDAVLWAVDQGITNGITATTFEPWKACSRAEIVTFLWRAMGSEAVETDKVFADVNAADFFYDAVAWAVENGVTTGLNDTTFGAWANCYRCDAVTFIQRAVK